MRQSSISPRSISSIIFEGLHEANQLDLGDREPLASIWIGNRTRIAPHNDVPEQSRGAARSAAAASPCSRPTSSRNLYLGPVDNTPAGRPVSMVDLRRTRISTASRASAKRCAHAQVAELEPGDAIFIPSLWWHHVEGLAPVQRAGQLLVARRTALPRPPAGRAQSRHPGDPRPRPAPPSASGGAVRPLCVRQWQRVSTAHIPEGARGVLAPLDARTGRRSFAPIILQELSR